MQGICKTYVIVPENIFTEIRNTQTGFNNALAGAGIPELLSERRPMFLS